MREEHETCYVHETVLNRVLTIVCEYSQHDRPSPTITQLAQHVGCSEELILESLEFGRPEVRPLH
ncbi:hypothetical protein [Alkalicoccus chagannorensis]|uniref:hypothetical protein n=1 Tax=Alkalicoccus chagannorensis TaxID=427072 RepID=UPI000408A65A|nr:hypothetical protein [Alkalicoccus chagannorensis]